MISKYLEKDLKNISVIEKLEIIKAIEIDKELNEHYLEILDYLSRDEVEEVRAMVAEILILSNTQKAERILIKLLSDKDELVRANAADSLCNSNSLKVFDNLKKMISRDKSSLVRGYAILSLADVATNINYDMEELTNYMIGLLSKERVAWVKVNYYQALYKLGNKVYLGMLFKEINSRSYRNRCAVVNSLGELLSDENAMMIKSVINERLKVEKTVAVRSSMEKLFQSLGG